MKLDQEKAQSLNKTVLHTVLLSFAKCQVLTAFCGEKSAAFTSSSAALHSAINLLPSPGNETKKEEGCSRVC